eukprot:TRINITY_DN5272_c0_g1_i1.p1 TRINITY_DN5272_c0_g1~~TRINITY_DN5272_c0_g1_i1.p1  ORF type:complete len:439 (-),score=113.43 TRINITY_DN5272_c0_g1_i1:864-1994(-)
MTQFWAKAIKDLLRQKHGLTFTLEELRQDLKKDGLSPLCLEPLISFLLTDKKVFNADVYQSDQVGWSSWIWKQMFGPSTGVLSHQQKLVQQELLNEFADKFLKLRDDKASSGTFLDKLVLEEDVDKDLQTDPFLLSTTDKNVLINYLISSKRAASVIDPQKKQKLGLKLIDPKSKVITVTDVDKGILKLKEVVSLLQKRHKKLTEEMENSRKKAYEHKTRNQKRLALSQLKKSKHQEATLEKNDKSLDTLYSILETIENQTTDVEIFEAYKEGTRTLRELVRQSGLTPEKVDEVTFDLECVLADQREAEEALAAPIGLDFGEEDLEKELNELLAQSQSQTPTQSQDDLSTLPQLPSQLPRLSDPNKEIPSSSPLLV